jgi:hypothetical protein
MHCIIGVVLQIIHIPIMCLAKGQAGIGVSEPMSTKASHRS